MPSEPDLSHWPTLKKHSDGYSDLFPRICWDDQDLGLEAVLRSHINHPTHQARYGLDVREASRRIREAVRHDAYVGVKAKTRQTLAKAFGALDKVQKQFSEIEEAGQVKALRLGFAEAARSMHEHPLDLIQAVNQRANNKSKILSFLEGLPQVNEGRDIKQFSVIERLIEVWELIEVQAPGIYQSQGDTPEGRKFEDCLQAIFNQQREATGLNFVIARSAIGN